MPPPHQCWSITQSVTCRCYAIIYVPTCLSKGLKLHNDSCSEPANTFIIYNHKVCVMFRRSRR